jgi:hypothetical protein
MRTAAQFRDIVIKAANGNFVKLSDVATVLDATRNSRSIAWFNKQPAVLILITKQQDANVIETVDRVKALLPELKQWIRAAWKFPSSRSHRNHPRQCRGYGVDAACDRIFGHACRIRVRAPDDADHRGGHFRPARAGGNLRGDVGRIFDQ